MELREHRPFRSHLRVHDWVTHGTKQGLEFRAVLPDLDAQCALSRAWRAGVQGQQLGDLVLKPQAV
ncbi:hypothetical protein [Streptomyces virginiae]|uniref:hypothetical protein n=1 Tax=Streptomyces virginiae TaxID=1961 RepID=UPI0036A8EF92